MTNVLFYFFSVFSVFLCWCCWGGLSFSFIFWWVRTLVRCYSNRMKNAFFKKIFLNVNESQKKSFCMDIHWRRLIAETFVLLSLLKYRQFFQSVFIWIIDGSLLLQGWESVVKVLITPKQPHAFTRNAQQNVALVLHNTNHSLNYIYKQSADTFSKSD